MKKRIRVKVISPYDSLGRALEAAIERGMNRCDKYNETPLTAGQRNVLSEQIEQSFWLAMEDAGIEVK